MRSTDETAPRAAAIYCRISQDRDDKREGVTRQEKDCRRLAEDLGWEVAGTYVDNDVSASSGRPRPQWRRMIADVDAGRVNAVLAWHPDRLIRRPVELESFIDLVEKRGVAVSTCKAGDYDLSTASGKMVARMLGAAARHETDRMSERIKAVKRERAVEMRLWKGGSRPFGHRPVEGKPGHLEVVPEEAEVLLEMVDRFLAGASLRSLAKDLQRRGVLRTKGDAGWTTGDVGRMIQRPVAAGVVTYQGEIVGKGVWDAIIPEDKWLAARAVLADPSRKPSRGRKQKHLLSGIAVCGGPLDAGGECGAPIMANAVEYYRCSTGRGGDARPEGRHVYRKRSDLDAYARELAVARLSRPDARSLLLPSPASDEDPDRLAAQADQLRKRLADAADAYASGEITRVQLGSISSRLKADLEDLESRIAVAANVTPQPVVPELAANPTDRAEEVWDALSPDRQRDVLRALVRLTVMPSDRRGRNPFKTEDVRVGWLA